jgi:(p)ppGpp synthase/HD superfamily hydrolase
VIAALLHDAVEDGGGHSMLERIRSVFGDDVAAIVEACSDRLDSDDRRSWRERKEDYWNSPDSAES